MGWILVYNELDPTGESLLEPPAPRTDSLFWDEIYAARRSTPAERFLDGVKLFRMGMAWSEQGIRMQHPQATDAEVLAILRDRIARQRRLEDKVWTKLPESIEL